MLVRPQLLFLCAHIFSNEFSRIAFVHLVQNIGLVSAFQVAMHINCNEASMPETRFPISNQFFVPHCNGTIAVARAIPFCPPKDRSNQVSKDSSFFRFGIYNCDVHDLFLVQYSPRSLLLRNI